jgi:hypothetical protein
LKCTILEKSNNLLGQIQILDEMIKSPKNKVYKRKLQDCKN